MNESSTGKKWYQEFWAWFILSPLIVVFIVSSFTVTVAVRGADDRVIENYYKEGRMINASFVEDARAVELGITLAMQFDQELQEVLVDVSESSGVLPQRLTIEMLHPSEFDFDRQYQLTQLVGNRYQAELAPERLQHKRYLRVTAEFDDINTPAWRVRGEVNFSPDEIATEITLIPEA